jgi:2-polyprenyl-3-methyl-5-hydroxy-6-metoxy-1,4-benzoquinol methylase
MPTKGFFVFDYSNIPSDFYDNILLRKKGTRSFWHYHKFDSVIRLIPDQAKGNEKSILDVGCFGGSFLANVSPTQFGDQVGIDILESQICYAQKNYSTEHRRFYTSADFFRNNRQKFSVVTLIEVIEHLTSEQIFNLLNQIYDVLDDEGYLIITTPNYLSFWPLLEKMIDIFSDLKYEEQHLTKFNFLNIERKLATLSGNRFRLEHKTTSHFLTPFIASVSYPAAEKLSSKIPASDWRNPFGNLILTRLKKS